MAALRQLQDQLAAADGPLAAEDARDVVSFMVCLLLYFEPGNSYMKEPRSLQQQQQQPCLKTTTTTICNTIVQ